MLIITVTSVFAVLAGVSGYLLTRRDLSQRQAALVGVGCAALVGFSFLFVLYLAVLAFIFAAALYWVLGSRVSDWVLGGRVSVKKSLTASAVALTGLLAASAVAMAVALNGM